MRALVLEKFGQLVVGDRPNPVPGDNEAVIGVVATGICGSDVHGFTGENGRRHPGQVMGHETVGRVVALGSAVVGLTIGQPVTVNPVVLPAAARKEYAGREQHCPDKYVIGVRPDLDAAFADLLLCPSDNVIPLSPDTPILLGALIEPLAVAIHAISRVEPQEGEKILIIGGGPIGQSIALALILSTGVKPLVAELDPARRELLEALGARTLDPQAAGFSGMVSRILGGAADVVIDAVGVNDTLTQAFNSSRLGSRICLVGMGSPELTIDAFRISIDERQILGSFTYSDDDFRYAARLIAKEPERASLLISRTIEPDEAHSAFEQATNATAPPGKTLVRFRSDTPEIKFD